MAALLLAGPAASMAVGIATPAGDGLTLNVAWPCDQVEAAVQEIVDDGVIYGTWQYRDEKTLPGAVPGPVPDPFGQLPQGTSALYQVRRSAVSPAHFLGSADIGTVIVRFALLPMGDSQTRLTINAVFIEDGHRTRHLSDGSVETSEFAEIASHFKPLNPSRGLENSDEKIRYAERTLAEAAGEVEDQHLTELRKSIVEEQTALKADEAQIHELDIQRKFLRRQAQLRVSHRLGPLRVGPYSAAAVLETLPQYEEVTVLRRTPFWYEVQTARGSRGWIHYLLLESIQ